MSLQKQQLSLRWNNYLRHVTSIFDDLRNREDLVDVTLYCEGKKIRAHKMLLSACSTYFRDVFKENPCQHPVIIFRNVQYEDLDAIIYFMYHGEVNITKEQLASFLTTAELLEVQGLTDEFDEKDQDTHCNTNDLEIVQDDNLINEDNTDSFPHAKKRKISIKRQSTFDPTAWVDNSLSNINNSNVLKLEEAINIENETAVVIDTNIPSTSIIPYTEEGETCDSEVFLNANLLNELKSTEDNQPIPDEPQEIVSDTTVKETQGAVLTISTDQGDIGEFNYDNVKVYKCSRCPKSFKHPLSLTQHSKIHSGDTKCKVCSKILSRVHDLKVHQAVVHGINK